MNTNVVLSTGSDPLASDISSHFSPATGMITGAEEHCAITHGPVTSELGASLRQ
jgi:hypothetical protein